MDANAAPASKWNRQKKWKWSFIFLTLAVVVFYILGGALIGSSISNCYSYYTYSGSTYRYSTSCVNYSQYWAGWAFLIISILLSVAWVVMVVLRFTSWYRKGLYQAPVVYQPSQYGVTNAPAAAPVAAPVAPPYHEAEKTAPTTTTVPQTAPEPAPTGLCMHCEHPTAGGAFCSNCGKAQ